MRVSKNILLKDKTTLRVGGVARYFIETENIKDAVSFAKEKNLPIFILGGGSNIVLPDEDMDAVVISPAHKGMELLSEDNSSVLVKVGAAVELDDFIEETVNRGWWGLENLSWIPGFVAGLAVQNVGAYGAEASSYIEKVDVFDIAEDKEKTLLAEECEFGYRKSIFNTTKKGRYVIAYVYLRLSKKPRPTLTYRGLEDLGEIPTQKEIREKVIEIRKAKDLDPQRVSSVGSFFKNIEVNDVSSLPEEIQIKCFKIESGYKIPSAALIDYLGLKGFCIGGACVSSVQANMLVNSGNATSAQIQELYEHVCKKVYSNFGIELVNEPEFV